MSQPSSFWWQKYGTLAQMAQAAVALLGFGAILFQINEIGSNNRAASARQVFLAYTDLDDPRFVHSRDTNILEDLVIDLPLPRLLNDNLLATVNQRPER